MHTPPGGEASHEQESYSKKVGKVHRRGERARPLLHPTGIARPVARRQINQEV